MASLFRPTFTRNGVSKRAKVWWASWKDGAGKWQRRSLGTRDKGAAQLLLADLVRHGVQTACALESHLAAWEAAMQARRVTDAHVRLVLYRVRAVLCGLQWTDVPHMSATAAERWIGQLQHSGRRIRGGMPEASAKTRNDYTDSLRAFGRFLVQRRACASSPFDGLRHVATSTDRRHDRIALTEAELAILLRATLASERVYWGLTGHDRHTLYLTAAATGFRAAELASLTRDSFELNATPPVVALTARNAKNRRAVRQPLPASVVPILRSYLRGISGPVWPGKWVRFGSLMMARDLKSAGIPYVVQGPEGPLYHDLHALRHHFIGRLDQPGISLRVAMELARHSDPRLTMKVYARARLCDLGAAVDAACAALGKASGTLPAALGTDGPLRAFPSAPVDATGPMTDGDRQAG